LSENFAALCDPAGPAALLLAFPAAAPGAFPAFVFARAADSARSFPGADVLELFLEVLGIFLGVFLRNFLDIRLPFVAFGGSIMGVLRVLSGARESATVQVFGDCASLRRLCKSDGAGVWLQEFDAPVRSLKAASAG
jgi:hypothetical protein